MFKYTKRLISDIRFWCQELELRYREDNELERQELRHPMAGFYFYQTIKRERAERKEKHRQQREAIQ